LSTSVDLITKNIYEIVDVVIKIIMHTSKTKYKEEIIESATDLFACLMEKASNYIVKQY